jgi:hypothetical protein
MLLLFTQVVYVYSCRGLRPAFVQPVEHARLIFVALVPTNLHRLGEVVASECRRLHASVEGFVQARHYAASGIHVLLVRLVQSAE